MLKIGNIEINRPVIQAPLSGYSDYAMRKVSRDCGVEFTFAGLMLDTSAAHPRVISQKSYQPWEDEHPVGAQIHGREPEIMVKAAKAVVNAGYDLIDLNFACPARKVLARRRGGYLLNEPERAIEIFKQIRDAVDCPVTAKLRSGYERCDESIEKFWQLADGLVENGIDMICVHGRSVGQKYSGKANWDFIKQVKLKYPDTVILGSGDLFKADDSVEKLRSSGVDGIAIARGAIGNPWLFDEIRAALEDTALPEPPTLKEQGEMMLKHFNLILELYTKKNPVGYFRKFTARYALRHPQRKLAAMEMMQAKKINELKDAINKWYFQ